MVKHLIILFISFSSLVFSGEFTASVSQKQVHVGESFTLNLTLKEASAAGTPSINSLKTAFIIHSQQQLYSTVIINGKVSSNTTWKLTLIPQKEGDLNIPAISVDTSEGLLTTAPIAIQVSKADAGGNSSSNNTNGLALTSALSNAHPYKNEPFIYTLRLISNHDLANVQMQSINIEEAILEANGEPKIEKKVIDGVNKVIIEMSFFITPLKPGPLKIPSTIIQGGIVNRKASRDNSFFDNDFDAFFLMHGMNALQPFSLTSEELVVHVQPATAGINPWLPASTLKIEEIWDDSQTPQEGEPITRGFRIIAEGVKSAQLPNLSEQQIDNNVFKSYADKPELKDEIIHGKIISYRKEQYTLIPQQSGELTLPEISITWWDVTKNEKAVASIPSRTLQVLPALKNPDKIALADETMLMTSDSQNNTIQRDPLLYGVLASLMLLLLSAVIWAITLQKKIMRLSESSKADTDTIESPKDPPKKDKPVSSTMPSSGVETKKLPKEKKEKLPDLNPT